MYILFTTAEKNTKAIRLRIKCTITKAIKFDDNNLGRKLIFIKLKSKIQRYSYLPRINLCELFNEAKQRLSMQREPFYYFTVLRNIHLCDLSIVIQVPFLSSSVLAS